MTTIPAPYPYFTDASGNALEAGKIYIGVAGLDPRTNPIAVFQDEALTIAWAQPIRTVSGYPVFTGAVSNIQTATSAFSIIVTDVNGSIVFRDLNATGFVIAASLAAPGGAGLVGYDSTATYPAGSLGLALDDNLGFTGTSATKATQTLAVHIRECEVRVTQEGALGNGTANDATAIQNAIDQAELIAATKGGCDVVFPAGNFRINAGLRIKKDRVNLLFRGGAQLVPYGSFDTITMQSASAATFIYHNVIDRALLDETNKTGGKLLVGKYLANSRLDVTAAGGYDGIQLDTFNTVDVEARVTNLTFATAIYCLVRGGGSVGARSDVLRINKMVMGGNYVDGQSGLIIDGFVHTVVGQSVYGVNVGGQVLVTRNTIGAADNPTFLNFWDFETDFQKLEAVNLAAGQIAQFDSIIANGSRASSNIFVGAGFRDARFKGGRSTGAAQAGIAIAGVDTLVDGMKCMSNSSNQYTGTLNTFPGIIVGGSSIGTRVTNCRSGDSTTPTYQTFGAQIDTGATNFIVKDNDVRNNVSSGVNNGAGTSATRIVADNIA